MSDLPQAGHPGFLLLLSGEAPTALPGTRVPGCGRAEEGREGAGSPRLPPAARARPFVPGFSFWLEPFCSSWLGVMRDFIAKEQPWSSGVRGRARVFLRLKVWVVVPPPLP